MSFPNCVEDWNAVKHASVMPLIPSRWCTRRIMILGGLWLFTAAGCAKHENVPVEASGDEVLTSAATDVKPPPNETLLVKYPNEDSIVSIVQILAHRDRYDGKQMQIKGFLRVQFEGTAIYLSEEDADYGIAANGFWVSFDPGAVHFEGQVGPVQFHRKWVLIEGTFDKDDRGHLSRWQGSIKNVDRIEAL